MYCYIRRWLFSSLRLTNSVKSRRSQNYFFSIFCTDVVAATSSRKGIRRQDTVQVLTVKEDNKNSKQKAFSKWRPRSVGFGFLTKPEIKGSPSRSSVQTEPSGSSLLLQANERPHPVTLQPPTLLVTLTPPCLEKSNTSL